MSAISVPLPPHLDVKGNLSNNWKKFKEIWESYETVTGLDTKPEKVRVATFITCIGPDALDIHNALPYQSEDDRRKMAKILELWDNYCIGETNVIYERYKFNNCVQEHHKIENLCFIM